MILEMKQEHSPAEGVGVGIEYSFFKKDEKIASFYAKNKVTIPMEFEGVYNGENNYKVILEKIEKCPEGYKEGMLAYQYQKEDGTKVGIGKYEYNHYNSNNEIVGKIKYIYISPKRKKLFQLPKSYEYKEFTFKGEKYEMYDVRSGGQVNFCIYKENELVAIVERALTVINWLDNYTIYSLNDIDIEFLFLAAAHYDYLNFEINMPQGRTFNIETGDATIEYRKDILDKYDPDFKQKIIEMEK